MNKNQSEPDETNKKSTENSAGEFYVDDRCISCGACWAQAPDHFKSHEVHTYAYILNQPRSDSEKTACQIVLEICPVQAIGRENTCD